MRPHATATDTDTQTHRHTDTQTQHRDTETATHTGSAIATRHVEERLEAADAFAPGLEGIALGDKRALQVGLWRRRVVVMAVAPMVAVTVYMVRVGCSTLQRLTRGGDAAALVF